MRPFPRGQHLGPYYRFAATILWPTMMTLTRQDWEGAEHLGKPGTGMVIATNHLSWFDPIVVAHFLNDHDRVPRFLAKDSIFEVPFVGRIVSGAGQIPVYRQTDNASEAVRAAVEAVVAGEAVVVYPDGTLTRDPDLWPMTGKTGAARIALMSGGPVVPVAHWGAQDVMRPYAKEFRAIPPKTMHVLAGPPVDLADLQGLAPTADVLTEATSRIVDDVTGLLAKLRGQAPPAQRWNPGTGRHEPVQHPLPAVAPTTAGSRRRSTTKRNPRPAAAGGRPARTRKQPAAAKPASNGSNE